jgi:hypothetical protein
MAGFDVATAVRGAGGDGAGDELGYDLTSAKIAI